LLDDVVILVETDVLAESDKARCDLRDGLCLTVSETERRRSEPREIGERPRSLRPFERGDHCVHASRVTTLAARDDVNNHRRSSAEVLAVEQFSAAARFGLTLFEIPAKTFDCLVPAWAAAK
jgi:hypothetical protein